MARRWHYLVVAMLIGCGPIAASAGTPTLVLHGDGLANLRFGTRATLVVRTLGATLGRPTSPLASAPGTVRCGVDAAAAWRGVIVFVDRGVFVGYSVTANARTPLRADNGLAIGDTVAQARRIFGRRLRLSGNQGGAWFARIPTGRYYGFLAPSGPPPGPRSTILSIEAGRVGCPAMTP